MEQRLGRGLDSLIARTLQAEGQASTQDLALAEIRINPGQPRKTIDDEGLSELASSIASHGVLQPIVVRRIEGGFEIVAGERRFRAAKLAGKSRIPATVIEADGIRSLELAIVENIQRENLTAIEEAAAYQQLIQGLGLTHQELASRVGKSRVAVTNSLRLLELPDQVRSLLQEGSLSAGQARALLGAEGQDRIVQLALEAASQKWTVREVEDNVRAEKPERAKRKPRESKRQGRAAALHGKTTHYQDQLRLRYGTRATIHEVDGRGEIRMAFYSEADRDRLLTELLRHPADS